MANPYGFYDQNGNFHPQNHHQQHHHHPNHHQPYQVQPSYPFQAQNGPPIAAMPPAYAQGQVSRGHPMVVIPPRAPDYAQHYMPQYQHQQMGYPMQYVPQQPPPQQPSPQMQNIHVRQQPSPQMQNAPVRQQPQVQIPQKPPKPPDPPPESQVDVQMLALSLADEYITIARSMGPLSSIAAKEEDLQTYHKLMATALGCIQSVLNSHRKLHPRLEAVLRLRYAGLLYEETENYGEAETELGKGIIVCQRSRMLDLKYCMQHLLARVLFKKSSQAGLKSLDRAISEAEANEHTVWIYALRFLRVSLSMQSQPHPDSTGAIQNLHSICSVAEQAGDISVNFTASALEALLHLRSTGLDNAKQAQLCIGSARRFQLQTSVDELGPVITLLNCVDLASSLMQHSPDQASTKLKEIVRLEDQTLHVPKGGKGGDVLEVPCDQSRGGPLTGFTDGIFEKLPDGRDAITFNWAQPNDILILGFFLAAITKSLSSYMDGAVESCLRSGTKMVDGMSAPVRVFDERANITAAALILAEEMPDETGDSNGRLQWLSTMRWLMRFHFALILCTRSDWPTATKLLNELSRSIDKAKLSSNKIIQLLVKYLGGVVSQGSGDVSGALKTYQSPELSILAPRSGRSTDGENDVRILAALNALLIIGSDPAQHETAAPLLAKLATVSPQHPSKAI